MLGLNTKKTIDERKENFIATKHFDDCALKELVDYMLNADSVVTRLILTDGSLSKDSIEYLIKNYGHKLEELDISENGLKDSDIEPLIRLSSDSSLKVLCVNNNFLSAAIVSALKAHNFNYLEADDQEIIEEPPEKLANTSFTPQHCGMFEKTKVTQENSVSIGQKTLEELLKNPQFSEFFKTANLEEKIIFFKGLKEVCVNTYQKQQSSNKNTPE